MKRKIVTFLLAVSLFSAVPASAAVCEVSGNTVSVQAEAEPGERKIMLLVKSGTDISDNSNIYAVKESVADNDGCVIFTFSMAAEKNGLTTDGEYDIYVRKNGKTEKIGSMFYATPESRESIIQNIKGASDENDLSGIFENYDNLVVLKAMGFNMDAYAVLGDDKGDVSEMVYGYTKNAETAEEYANAFALAISAVNINNGEDVSLQLKNADMEFEKVKYSDIKEKEQANFIDEYISEGTYESIDELVQAYAEANILYIINNTRYDDMEDILKKYADEIGIKSSSEYDDYLDADSKKKVNEKLVSKLKSSPAKTVRSLLSKIEDAVEETEKKASSGGSSGGGGGGGGSSKPSGAVSVGAVPSADVKLSEEINVEKPIFTDLAEAEWAKDAITKMYEEGIISGDGDGRCRPNDSMKREEFIKMLVLSLGIYDEFAECDFGDVPKYSWSYRYIASAYNAGIINGVSENRFGIGNLLTRQDMALICSRSASGRISLEEKRDDAEFSDKDSISDYAKEAVSMLYKAEVINGMGDNCFEPFGTATRAQGAVMLYNLFK